MTWRADDSFLSTQCGKIIDQNERNLVTKPWEIQRMGDENSKTDANTWGYTLYRACPGIEMDARFSHGVQKLRLWLRFLILQKTIFVIGAW